MFGINARSFSSFCLPPLLFCGQPSAGGFFLFSGSGTLNNVKKEKKTNKNKITKIRMKH